jgi:DNA-binding transcriptional MerR regulator
MEILKEKYSITELSEILQVTDHALRFYEKEFNLIIPKDNRGRRYYTTEMANIMFQIKAMRNEGLEIKAIKKILQSDNIIKEPPPVVTDNDSVSLVAADFHDNGIKDMKAFFNDFKDQLTNDITMEIATTKEYLSKEISKSKLELGACVENGMRKLEAKMERHFLDVDHALGVWREKSRKNVFKNLLSKTLK